MYLVLLKSGEVLAFIKVFSNENNAQSFVQDQNKVLDEFGCLIHGDISRYSRENRKKAETILNVPIDVDGAMYYYINIERGD